MSFQFLFENVLKEMYHILSHLTCSISTSEETIRKLEESLLLAETRESLLHLHHIIIIHTKTKYSLALRYSEKREHYFKILYEMICTKYNLLYRASYSELAKKFIDDRINLIIDSYIIYESLQMVYFNQLASNKLFDDEWLRTEMTEPPDIIITPSDKLTLERPPQKILHRESKKRKSEDFPLPEDIQCKRLKFEDTLNDIINDIEII